MEHNNTFEVFDPSSSYVFNDLIYGREAYDVIGYCMEVHNFLGKGFSEVVYKDGLVEEFNASGIRFEREREFKIVYKSVVLPHNYFCDFIIDNKLVLEVKAHSGIVHANNKQLLNYLAVTKLKLGLLVNFGEDCLKFKRVIL
jgi:GxxExxY protein